MYKLEQLKKLLMPKRYQMKSIDDRVKQIKQKAKEKKAKKTKSKK